LPLRTRGYGARRGGFCRLLLQSAPFDWQDAMRVFGSRANDGHLRRRMAIVEASPNHTGRDSPGRCDASRATITFQRFLLVLHSEFPATGITILRARFPNMGESYTDIDLRPRASLESRLKYAALILPKNRTILPNSRTDFCLRSSKVFGQNLTKMLHVKYYLNDSKLLEVAPPVGFNAPAVSVSRRLKMMVLIMSHHPRTRISRPAHFPIRA